MREFFGTYLSRGSVRWIVSQWAMKFAVYRWRWCSKQRGAANYLVSWYLLTIFARGILGTHCWWHFVPVRHWPTRTCKTPGNGFFRHVVARLQCRLYLGPQFDRNSSWISSLWYWSKLPWNNQKLPSKFLYWIYTAEPDSGGISDKQISWEAYATLSAVICSTSSLRWVTTVCWFYPYTR